MVTKQLDTWSWVFIIIFFLHDFSFSFYVSYFIFTFLLISSLNYIFINSIFGDGQIASLGDDKPVRVEQTFCPLIANNIFGATIVYEIAKSLYNIIIHTLSFHVLIIYFIIFLPFLILSAINNISLMALRLIHCNFLNGPPITLQQLLSQSPMTPSPPPSRLSNFSECILIWTPMTLNRKSCHLGPPRAT